MAMGTNTGFEDICELIDLLADKFKREQGPVADVVNDELREVAELHRNSRTDRLRVVVEGSYFPKL